MTGPVEQRLVGLAAVDVVVPDPAATAGWLAEALGFVVHEHGVLGATCGGEYAMDAPLHSLRLHQGEAFGLRGITLLARADHDLERLTAALTAAGAAVTSAAADALVVRVQGVEVEVRRDVATTDGPLPPSPIRPRRLGHVNLQVPDPVTLAGMLVDGFGMRLSERIGQRFHFLRFGSEHHNIGLRGGAGPTAHHIAFEVPGWDSYRVLGDHLAALGHRIEYGPGRHGPGRNMFVYVRDPSSGMRLELFSDMAHIADEDRYVAPTWEVADRPMTVNTWGPAPPESFL